MATLSCKNCSKEYRVPKYRESTSKYCSRDCQNKGQYQSIEKECQSCRIKFDVSNSRANRKFCSELCSKVSKKDLKQRRKDSKRISRISRGTFTGATLRKFVFSVKEPICEICGYSEYRFCLDVHHVDEGPKNNDISNLAVLCVMCHRKLHKGVIEYAIKKGKF